MTQNTQDETLLTPRYLNWAIDFIIYLTLTIIILYWADSLLLEERRFKYEFTMISIGVGLLLLAILFFLELTIFIKFLKTETSRRLYFMANLGILRIEHNRESEILSLDDLKTVIFSQRRFSSRSPTMNLEYSELIFKSGRSILITSYLMDTKKLEKFLGHRKYLKSYRNRGNFEGIKKTSTAANNS